MCQDDNKTVEVLATAGVDVNFVEVSNLSSYFLIDKWSIAKCLEYYSLR